MRLFAVISFVAKFIFTLAIYLFIFAIMRLIYLDIRSMNANKSNKNNLSPYLKLINQRETMDFKVDETYILDRDMSIGRSDSNQIVIKDPFISATHARFLIKFGNYYLSDLRSSNGTFVNGQLVESAEEKCLANGDKIKFGNVDFLFVQSS
jgi:pSer/pThr/pTyr-binding forkhead associated (FHA) protein